MAHNLNTPDGRAAFIAEFGRPRFLARMAAEQRTVPMMDIAGHHIEEIYVEALGQPWKLYEVLGTGHCFIDLHRAALYAVANPAEARAAA